MIDAELHQTLRNAYKVEADKIPLETDLDLGLMHQPRPFGFHGFHRFVCPI